MAVKTIGFYFNKKDYEKMLTLPSFLLKYNSSDIKFIQVDITKSISQQGHFDYIFHRVLDQYIEAHEGNEEAKQQINNILKYHEVNPECEIINPLKNLDPIIDRKMMCDVLEKLVSSYNLGDNTFVPEYLTIINNCDIVDLVSRSNLLFPIICKPKAACSANLTGEQHQMLILFKKEDLVNVKTPCILQNFVNHNAVIFKLFTLGKTVYIQRRLSVKNICKDDDVTKSPIYFLTKDVSKVTSKSALNELDEKEKLLADSTIADDDYLRHIALCCCEAIGIDWLGIDVIIDAVSGKYAIIDLNYFPIKSCEAFPSFFEDFLNYFRLKSGIGAS